tara:strand:- start:90 stop:323 length:234 start_codon:yes stop_codon:yes gene_type:complete
MAYIIVWYYNNLIDDWKPKLTSDLKQTKDESKYFKVINTLGEKEFYYSFNDYMEYKSNNINLLKNIYDVKGNLLWSI